MKKKAIVLILLLFVVGAFAATYRMSLVGADSGFDSSWDSGSDFGGFGDSDIDIFYLIYLIVEHPIILIIILVLIFIFYVGNKSKQKEIINNALNGKLELLDINKFPEEKRLEIQAFNIYKELQYAWMNFDEERIRKLTTDEMYNMYLMQLDTLKVKNQKNIMYDIKYISSSIKNKREENGEETITINMQISCYDFLIDNNTKKVLRGIANKLNFYSYELTFVKTIDNKELDICPRCGAPVEANNSGICEYCKSTLVSDSYTLVLSKKKMLSQK